MLHVDNATLILVKNLFSKDRNFISSFINSHNSEGSNYNFKQISVTGKMGIGVIELNDSRMDFHTWLNKYKNINVLEIIPFKDKEQINHIAIKLQLDDTQKTFFPKFHSSRYYEMTENDFIELLNAQDNPTSIQERIKKYLLETTIQEEDISIINSMSLVDYLKSNLGKARLDFELGNFILEIQKECKKSGKTFLIPSKFGHMFICTDYEKEAMNNMSEEEKSKHIPLNEIFYLNNATSEDYKNLIDAQKCSEEIYQDIMKDFHSIDKNYVDKFKTTEDLKAIFSKENEEDFYNYPTGNVINDIILTCRRNKAEIVFPPSLDEKVQFPFKDSLNDPEFIPENERYLPINNKNAYTDLFFTEIDLSSFEMSSATTIEQAKKDLLYILDFCENFAKRTGSFYVDCFKSAKIFLVHLENSLKNDPPGIDDVLAFLKSEHFTDFQAQSIQTLEHNIRSIDIFFNLRLSKKSITNILVLSITNVIGGMGAWNDQGVQDPSDNKDLDYSIEELSSRYRHFLIATLNS